MTLKMEMYMQIKRTYHLGIAIIFMKNILSYTNALIVKIEKVTI